MVVYSFMCSVKKARYVLHGQAMSELRGVSEVWCHTILHAEVSTPHLNPSH